MKTISSLMLLAALVILTGCTMNTSAIQQQPDMIPAKALDKDTYVISLNGNDINSEGRPLTPLLKRCAALTLSKGYKFFQINVDPSNVNACTLNANQVGCMTLKMFTNKEDASNTEFSPVYDAEVVK